MALSCCPSLAAQGADAHGSSIGHTLTQLKKAAQALFIPSLGGSADVWAHRPLPAALLEYAAADVAHLHAMRDAWGALVSQDEMASITHRRFEGAIGASIAAKGDHMAVRDF